MTPRDFVNHLSSRLIESADTTARENGSSRDRTLDQYRYQAGVVAGLRMAALMIDEEFKRLLQDDSD